MKTRLLTAALVATFATVALVPSPVASQSGWIYFADGRNIRQNVMADIDVLVSHYVSTQVLDPLAVNYGSFSHKACYSSGESCYAEMCNEAPLALLAYAWKCPESHYYRNRDILASIQLGLLCLSNTQSFTGAFPVGMEVTVDGNTQLVGVQMQDYGDTPHQYFLGSCAFYAYDIVRDTLPRSVRDRLDTTLERLFEFSVIEPYNVSTRSLFFESLEYAHEQYYKEEIRVPKSILRSATRLDIVLRVEPCGSAEPATWRARIGDVVLALDTTRINPNEINPYREYTGWNPISVAAWTVDDVSQILPYGRLTEDQNDYVFDVILEPVASWSRENGYAIIRSQGDSEPSWISGDGLSWNLWEEDLALQAWVYGDNTDLVGGRVAFSNQEAGRFYLIHKARELLSSGVDRMLLPLADAAFEKEMGLFASITKDGVFPECNHIIAAALGDPIQLNEVPYGGWSPGHGMLSSYLIGLIAQETGEETLESLIRDASRLFEYLVYPDANGYSIMNAATARDNDSVILSNTSKNLLALGFISSTGSLRLRSILANYQSLDPSQYVSIPYPLATHQIDFMPLVTIHSSLAGMFLASCLPAQYPTTYMRHFAGTRLLVVKTHSYLYFISYGNATPSGGCIADKFNLATRQHEILTRGASLDYGTPLFELKNPDGSSSVWETQADIKILSSCYPFKIRFSGFLKYPNQVAYGSYWIEYELSDQGEIAWSSG